VPLHKSRQVKLGLFQHLNLADKAVLDREDASGLLLNLCSGGGNDKFLDERLEVALGTQLGHLLDHLGTDRTDLGTLRVTCGLHLPLLLFGEGDAEHADYVAIGGAAIDSCLDDGLFLLDEAADFVSCHVHPMEVGKAVESLNILYA